MHLADLLWTVIVIFFMVIFFIMLFRVILDIFRSNDLSGWAKAAWLIALFFFSLITLLIYVIVRGKGMADRDVEQAAAIQQAQTEYIRKVAADGGGSTSADEIAKAHDLLTKGAISQAEFDAIKAKVLA